MRAVVLSSGGMDSTTVLGVASHEGYECRTISFDYGQKHRKELIAARDVASNYNVRHDIIDLKSVTSLLAESGSVLVGDKMQVPDGHYTEDIMKHTVVPNRNAMMANIAIAVAVAWKADTLWVGVHAGDHAVYPDCRPEFVDALQQLALVANEGFINPDFRVVAPFLNSTKADIADRGMRMAVPYLLTWTCYKGGDIHCGRCSTCVERLEAFDLAGYTDPVQYADRDYWRTVV